MMDPALRAKLELAVHEFGQIRSALRYSKGRRVSAGLRDAIKEANLAGLEILERLCAADAKAIRDAAEECGEQPAPGLGAYACCRPRGHAGECSS